MEKRHLSRKMIAVGIAVFFFALIIAPMSNAVSPGSGMTMKYGTTSTGSENQSSWNFTLPTARTLNKWKWGIVEFDEFVPDFYLNYSIFGTPSVVIGFNEILQCHTHSQVLPAWSEVSVALFWNESFIGGIKQGQITWSKWNWTTQLHLGDFAFRKEMFNNTDILGRVTLTGFPLRLHFFAKFVLPGTLFWWAWRGNWLLPFEEKRGTTIEFTIHIRE